MRPKHRRLTFAAIGAGLLGLAAVLGLRAMEEGLTYFHTPTQVAGKAFPADRRIRVGGLVEPGSLARAGGGVVEFRVTDMVHAVPVRYRGLLPDLFAEGQGVVAEGRMEGDALVADGVLARHDENYMPPEAAEALKQSGQWQHMRATMENAGQMEGARR